MAWTSGTVSSFTAFLQALIDFVAGDRYDQVVGTGDDIETTFPFTLGNGPVAKGQARLKFKIGATEYQVFDDGEGEWIHDEIASSSLDYVTREGSVTFANPLADLYDMVCTYVVGKNGGEEGRDWLLLHHRNSRNSLGADAFPGLDLKECWLKNSGVSFKERIYVGLRECQYVAGAFYNINFNVDYEFGIPPDDDADWNFNKTKTGGTSYNATYENYDLHPSIALADDNMAYWIMSNKNRIMGAVRVAGNRYETFYLGSGLRLASPSRYSYPLMAIGSIVGNRNYTDESVYHKYILISDGYRIWVIGFGETFLAQTKRYVMPMEGDFQDRGQVTKTTTGKILLYPCFIRQLDESVYSLLMQLDGVFIPLDNLQQSENTIDVGGEDYLVVQNIFRNTYKDFLAMKLE